jgi:hypothetical protein
MINPVIFIITHNSINIVEDKIMDIHTDIMDINHELYMYKENKKK